MITSLLLLLRAIYTKLEKTKPKTPEAENFMAQIEPCIWRKDKLSGKVDYTRILITSKATDDEFNERLNLILMEGEADEDWHDNYSVNYRIFQQLYDDLNAKNALLVYNFVHSVLNCAIVLPIQADTQDTALTIFNTLNDRGLPLSDADIFKAKIYETKQGADRDAFVKAWKEIESKALDVDESMQHLFYIYMFYRRALDGDVKTTTPGARKYFERDKYAKLREEGVLDHIREILVLQTVAKTLKSNDDEPWSANVDILRMFDMFAAYPNEWWQYPVVTFYMTHKDKDGFEGAFLKFLRKLYGELLRVYIGYPTVNSVKGGVLKLDVASTQSMHPDFDFRAFDMEGQQFSDGVVKPYNKHTRRMVLAAVAYDEDGQEGLLPGKWEIEHIFPQHWQANYDLGGYTPEKLSEVIEEIGNLMPLEKPLNIGASDGYYKKKKEKYAESDIAVAKKMAERDSWKVDDIFVRNVRMVDTLKGVIKRWNDEYGC